MVDEKLIWFDEYQKQAQHVNPKILVFKLFEIEMLKNQDIGWDHEHDIN